MTGNYAELRKIWREQSAAVALDRRSLDSKSLSEPGRIALETRIRENTELLAELHPVMVAAKWEERPSPKPLPDLDGPTIDADIAQLTETIDRLRLTRGELVAERARRQLIDSARRKLTPEERAAVADAE